MSYNSSLSDGSKLRHHLQKYLQPSPKVTNVAGAQQSFTLPDDHRPLPRVLTGPGPDILAHRFLPILSPVAHSPFKDLQSSGHTWQKSSPLLRLWWSCSRLVLCSYTPICLLCKRLFAQTEEACRTVRSRPQRLPSPLQKAFGAEGRQLPEHEITHPPLPAGLPPLCQKLLQRGRKPSGVGVGDPAPL